MRDLQKLFGQARWLIENHDTIQAAAGDSKINRNTLKYRYQKAMDLGIPPVPPDGKEGQESPKEKLKTDFKDETGTITYIGVAIATPDELIAHAEIDTDIWEVERIVCNNWEVAGKRNAGQKKTKVKRHNKHGEFDDEVLSWQGQELWKTGLRQIKVWLKKKAPQQKALEDLLELIKEQAYTIPLKRPKKKKAKRRLALEISIMDPHMGLQCYTPEADQRWDLELCEQFYLFAVEDLIQQTQAVADIEKILWVFGNDFNHADNIKGETTGGTNQPENVAQHRSILRGEQLAISAAELMLQHAPVDAVQIPGNHDRLTSYMQGRVLNAWFHNNSDFNIEADTSPFKKFRWGASLLGLEHGHSISAVRMAALMANEWRFDFAETHYHEWHCGDQHRKGTSKPSAFEEQGVSVEYLAGLVAPNEWHRLKSFNFQKRAANAFIWDYDCGQVSRLTTNISKYTGRFLGDRYDKWLAKKREERSRS